MILIASKNYVKKHYFYIRRDNILIKDIPINDRPRERLIQYGPSNLSNNELLSIILKDGTHNTSVNEIANNLLNKLDKFTDLRYITYEELVSIKGIGSSKACTILATIELSKRLNTKVESLNNISFTSTDIVFEYYKNKIGYKKQEEFYAIYLDSRNMIIKEKLLFIGTINYSMVHPRDVFKEAYILNAVSIICIHNHPTGDITPSKDDINITNNLKQVGNLLGIKVLDHIIISPTKFYSFLENGDL